MKIMLTDNPLQPASITESLFLSHYSIYFNLVHEKSIYDSVLSATNSVITGKRMRRCGIKRLGEEWGRGGLSSLELRTSTGWYFRFLLQRTSRTGRCLINPPIYQQSNTRVSLFWVTDLSLGSSAGRRYWLEESIQSVLCGAMSTLLQLLGTIPHSVLTMMKMKRRRGLRGGEEEEEKEEKRKERRLQREGKVRWKRKSKKGRGRYEWRGGTEIYNHANKTT